MIEPFANDHQSMQVGDLVIENQQDKIIIYGDADLTLDGSGYQQAQQLQTLMTKIMQAYEDKNIYSDSNSDTQLDIKSVTKSKENDDQSGTEIDNPFL